MIYKKRLIILVSSIFIYLTLMFLYNKFITHDCKEVFVLKEDLLRGETLQENSFERVSLKENKKFFYEAFNLEENIEEYVLTKDLSKGCILLKEDVVKKTEYNNVSSDSEIISIKISNPDDIVSYQIEKDSIVNVYYTGKLDLAKGILNDIDLSYINTNSSNKIDNQYMTIKLIENAKVINVFDKYGNVVKNNNHTKTESNKIDTVMFEVKKDLVMKINNLKKYGQFSISVMR